MSSKTGSKKDVSSESSFDDSSASSSEGEGDHAAPTQGDAAAAASAAPKAKKKKDKKASTTDKINWNETATSKLILSVDALKCFKTGCDANLWLQLQAQMNA